MVQERVDKTTIENEDVLLTCAITGIYLNSDYFSHFRGTSNIGYLKVKKDDLILSAQNLHLGNANINTLFEHGIVSPAYKVFQLKKWDPLFANAWVKRSETNQFWDSATTAGASLCRKNIVWEDLLDQNILIPCSLDEQQKIGAYFKNLDSLITLHQRKSIKIKIEKF